MTSWSRARVSVAVGLAVGLAVAAVVVVRAEPRLDEAPFHSFKPPYDPQARIMFWDHGGDAAMYAPYVQLTSDRPEQTGYLWNTVPSVMTEWQAILQFRLSGWPDMGGNGFAFWYTEKRELVGPVFGSHDFWAGLGIFFDTFPHAAGESPDHQSAPPTVMAILNDGTQRYDLASDGKTQAAGQCEMPVRNTEVPAFVRILYQGGQLSVHFDLQATGTWTECFTVQGVRLGVDKFFGLTAHTSDLADAHDVYALSIKDLTPENADLQAVRADYEAWIGEQYKSGQGDHQEYGETQFQHTLLTVLNQMQDSINMLEVGQIQIGHMVTALPAAQAMFVAQASGQSPAEVLAEERKRFEEKKGRASQALQTVSSDVTGLAQTLRRVLEGVDAMRNKLQTCGTGTGAGAGAAAGGTNSNAGSGGGGGADFSSDPNVQQQAMAHNMHISALQQQQQQTLANMATSLQAMLSQMEKEVGELKLERQSLNSQTGDGQAGQAAKVFDQFTTIKDQTRQVFEGIRADIDRMKTDMKEVHGLVDRVNRDRQLAKSKNTNPDVYSMTRGNLPPGQRDGGRRKGLGLLGWLYLIGSLLALTVLSYLNCCKRKPKFRAYGV